jgi:hypothetical protein
MPPTFSTSSVPSATATLQYLQTTYGPQARVAGTALSSFYFSNLTLFQVLSVLFTTACIALTVYIVVKTGWVRSRISRVQDVVFKSDFTKKTVRTAWEDIQTHFFAGSDNDLKIAIIEADTLLDEALRESGIIGTNLGDRLKKVKTMRLPNIEDVWQAHKIRNRIAHEPDFALKRDLAERVLTVYEEAFAHLGYLDTKGRFSAHPHEES